MATRTAPQPIAHMSEEEFLALVDEKPSLEYIDGAVYRKPVAGRRHGRIVMRVLRRIDTYADEHGGWCGPEVHVNFSEAFHRVYRVPDASYWAPGTPEGDTDIPLPPTLAVEVRSPSQSLDELRDKCRFMLDSGVAVCWLVDPVSRTVEVFEGEDVRVLATGEVLESEHLPGFALPLADLFAVLER